MKPIQIADKENLIQKIKHQREKYSYILNQNDKIKQKINRNCTKSQKKKFATFKINDVKVESRQKLSFGLVCLINDQISQLKRQSEKNKEYIGQWKKRYEYTRFLEVQIQDIICKEELNRLKNLQRNIHKENKNKSRLIKEKIERKKDIDEMKQEIMKVAIAENKQLQNELFIQLQREREQKKKIIELKKLQTKLKRENQEFLNQISNTTKILKKQNESELAFTKQFRQSLKYRTFQKQNLQQHQRNKAESLHKQRQQ